MATSSKIRDTIVIDQKFDYLYRRESGEFVAVVVNNDGSTTETEFNLHKNPSQTLITDGKGDSLVYSQNGHLMGIKEYRATGGNKALLNDYHRKKDSNDDLVESEWENKSIGGFIIKKSDNKAYIKLNKVNKREVLLKKYWSNN